METLITYHGDPAFKARFLEEIGKHEQADALVQGTYGNMNGHFRGCAVGCSLNSLNVIQGKPATEQIGIHARYPTELGWPLWLAHLEDGIFENLPLEQAKTWPRRLSDAVPVGVTVPDRVLAQILRWCLVSEPYGCIHATDDAGMKAIVARMGALFDRSISGDEPKAAEWGEAARAARAAWAARDAWAAWAAWDAWAARDAWAAWAAWDAWAARAARAAWAARDAWAAWAARDAWAARAAGVAFYPALSEEVIRLLRELSTEQRAA
jgi:hypothetical protein